MHTILRDRTTNKNDVRPRNALGPAMALPKARRRRPGVAQGPLPSLQNSPKRPLTSMPRPHPPASPRTPHPHPPQFVFYADRLNRLIVEAGLGHLPFIEKQASVEEAGGAR
jgi:hypothetical protein